MVGMIQTENASCTFNFSHFTRTTYLISFKVYPKLDANVQNAVLYKFPSQIENNLDSGQNEANQSVRRETECEERTRVGCRVKQWEEKLLDISFAFQCLALNANESLGSGNNFIHFACLLVPLELTLPMFALILLLSLPAHILPFFCLPHEIFIHNNSVNDCNNNS